MATSQYQQELGATAACTVRLAEGCVNPEDDRIHTIQGDAWFGSVKAAAALGQRGFRAVLQVKNKLARVSKDGYFLTVANPERDHIYFFALTY